MLKTIKRVMGFPAPDEEEKKLMDDDRRLEEAQEGQAEHKAAAEQMSESFHDLQRQGTEVRRLSERKNGTGPPVTSDYSVRRRLKARIKKALKAQPSLTVSTLSAMLNASVERVQSIVHDLELEEGLA